jgi:hypothetical protein
VSLLILLSYCEYDPSSAITNIPLCYSLLNMQQDIFFLHVWFGS